MKKRAARLVTVLALLLSLCLLAACHDLAEGFEEDKMHEIGCQVIELCNARDYEGVLAMFDQELLGDVAVSDLADQLDPILDDLGAFEEFKTYAVAGSEDGNSGMDLGILAMRCAYENGKALYTITMTDEYQLVGLFVQ